MGLKCSSSTVSLTAMAMNGGVGGVKLWSDRLRACGYRAVSEMRQMPLDTQEDSLLYRCTALASQVALCKP